MPAISYSNAPNMVPAAVVHSKLATPSLPALDTTEALVDRLTQVITNYLLTTGPDDQFIAVGRGFLRSQLQWHVEQNKQLEFVLPAFPFKSPSRKKVLSSLPDLAEEIFLRRLEDLCRSVEDIYTPGAKMKIVSDGIVYGQLLGASDSTTYKYNSGLRQMVREFGLKHITFVRVRELLPDKTQIGEVNNEADYVKWAPITREAFLATDIGNYDVEEQLKTDEGALRTYRGYLRFLKLDLEDRRELSTEDGTEDFAKMSRKARERAIGAIAKKMMANGTRFAALVGQTFTTAIRLSIHPHTNAGPKFALRIFAGVEQAATPWHNVVVMKRDGTISIQHDHTVDRATHELVERRGRPYYWREIDSAMQWGDLKVEFDRMFPYGLLVRPAAGATISWGEVPMDKMRDLASRYSWILARGFTPLEKEEYRQAALNLGPIMSWVWGDILEVKENPELDMNNTTTREAMPFHYDGVFKVKTNEDGSLSDDPPQFQMFQCRHAPSASEPGAEAGGRTLFSNTALMYSTEIEKGVSPYASILNEGKWTVFTPSNASFGGKPLELPLVNTNSLSGHKNLRWHEVWPQKITACKPTECHVIGTDDEVSEKISNHITELLYDRRFTIEHTWQTGDYLIADNLELMHTRTAFNPCSRELWRVHVN